jgi:hypothetical protein
MKSKHPPGPPMTSSWRVQYLGKALGTVDASDEKSAIVEAAKEFHITPARRFLIKVTKISGNDDNPARR